MIGSMAFALVRSGPIDLCLVVLPASKSLALSKLWNTTVVSPSTSKSLVLTFQDKVLALLWPWLAILLGHIPQWSSPISPSPCCTSERRTSRDSLFSIDSPWYEQANEGYKSVPFAFSLLQIPFYRRFIDLIQYQFLV